MQRGLIITVIVIALAIGAAGVLYAFGTPQAQGPSTEGSEPVTVSAGGDGEVPPPDPSSPLHIQIPGCVCHSDDPKIVEEHSTYRMNQCAGCHKDGVPTGQELTQ